jgi:hypothetical protein
MAIESRIYKDLSIKLIQDKYEILNYLQMGISLPIWKEFEKYIINDLEYYRAKSLLLTENGNPTGHSLLYNDNSNILYFGYFNILNHEKFKIQFLINQILEFAQKENFEIIRGPINIPTIIFGWGFMKEGSISNLFPGNPVNPPIYYKLFIDNGFRVYNIQNTWEGYLPRIDPWKIKNYDFHDYEYFYPQDFKELMELKETFLKIQSENLSKSAQITPNASGVFDSYADFVFKYGYNFMFFFVSYKPTQEIVACGCYLPNVFRKNSKGDYDSCITLTWAVLPEHRRKGLAFLMYGATSLLAWKKGIRYGGGPMSEENKKNREMAKKVGGKIGRTHLLLEYQIK